MKRPTLTNKSLKRIAQSIGMKKEDNKSSGMREDLIDFLSENPDPPDEEFHDWAESRGYDVDKAEAEAYKLATLYAKFSTGGKFNESSGVDEDMIDVDQLEMGIEVELEHTPDKETAKRIALDHLAEIGDYYTRLKKMEEDAGIKD